MTTVQSGQFRHPVTIVETTFMTDANGDRTPSTRTIARGYAKVEPLSGRELERAKGFAASVSHKLTMRYVRGILPTHQVQFGTRRFAVSAVLNEEERNQKLTLLCTEFLS